MVQENEVYKIVGYFKAEKESHHYEMSGTIFANRKEAKDSLNIGDKFFATLLKRGIIKKIEN